MKTTDINTVLLNHIKNKTGAAGCLRTLLGTNANRMNSLVENLFNAKSDIRRLYHAQEFANLVLTIYDFGDILIMRDIVAKQELRRLISYGKQKDHTAHTVYLYLLGIWLYDHSKKFRTAFMNTINESNATNAARKFLSQWLDASLLHDIGYAFFDLSDDTIQDRMVIDDIYSWRWITELYSRDEMTARRPKESSMLKFRAIHDDWLNKHGKHMPPPTASYSHGQTIEVLKRLDSAPWLAALKGDDDWKSGSVSRALSLGRGWLDLMNYGEQVARKGYASKNPTPGCVDHAVASGLLLFQYTSYWYWLMNQARIQNKFLYEKIRGKHTYEIEHLQDEVVPACRAVAYHNVQSTVAGADRILKEVTLMKHPLVYLAILCDELQNWDRYPAGDELFINIEECAFKYIEGGEILLKLNGHKSKKPTFTVRHKSADSIVSNVTKALARIPNWKQLLEYKA